MIRPTGPRSSRRCGRARRQAVVVLVLALAVAACTGGAMTRSSEAENRRVMVLGPWTGPEEDAFKALLAKSPVKPTPEYQGTAAQREVLLSQVQAGTPPDIVVMPNPGELADYARNGQLQELGPGLYHRTEYGAPWQPTASGTDDRHFWVPVKADLKSIVWHRSGVAPGSGPPGADAWCIGMLDDGASGWPGSDWIEDIMLQKYGPEEYARWAGGGESWTGSRMEAVWRAWGSLMAQDKGPHGKHPALLTDRRGTAGSNGLLYGGGSKGGHHCRLEHQGSFARAFYGRKNAPDARFVDSYELLPGGIYAERGREVSADFAAMFTKTRGSSELLKWLASAKAQKQWAKLVEPPVFSFSANSRAGKDTYRDPVSRKIAGRLTGRNPPRCLDASDVMPPAVRDAFYEAVLRFVAHPDQDLHKRLADVQRVQTEEKRKLGLDEKDRWMTGICS